MRIAPKCASALAAWQNGALSRDSMLDLFRRGEILPDGRTNEEEERLVGKAGAAKAAGLAAPVDGPGGTGRGPAGASSVPAPAPAA